jgi:cellulose synthase/poly-beta-1,6-N-acetylglucosamine synthase-like glycosyltransferase
MKRRILFWSAVGTVGATYALFPLLVIARARLRPRPHSSADITPSLTFIVAAHNEATDIGAKLENIASLDYPTDRLEVIVASDGCDDGTEEIVRGFAGRSILLLSLPRVGKAAALNAAIAAANGEILVFSDANSIYAPDALRALVRPFIDPDVGGVAGDQRYVTDPSCEAVGSGEQGYWDFDRMMKRAESQADNVVSATGAIYAVRASLVGPVPEGVTDDFYTSTGVIARGFRLVFAPDAVAFEPVARSAGLEFGRKVRVMTRGLRAVVLRRSLLDPRTHGLYSVQLLAHKVLRRLMVFPLATIALTSPLLWRRGRVYRAATVAQAALYGLGLLGLLVADKPIGRRKALALPAFFCFVNAAALRASWNVLSGRRIDRWEPRRDRHTSPAGVDRLDAAESLHGEQR